MTPEDVLQETPKVALHCHLSGTVQPKTWAELAQKHEVPVPPPGDADVIYAHINSRSRVSDMYQSARIRSGCVPSSRWSRHGLRRTAPAAERGPSNRVA